MLRTNKNIHNILPVTRMCNGICDTKEITGVEVSFADILADLTYTLVSNCKNLKFLIPCYLLEQAVKVTFKKNGQNEFEIPETL